MLFLEWKDLAVPSLKDELRKRKLVLKGKKGDLIQRLQEYERNLNEDFEAMDCNAELAALDICSMVVLSKSLTPSASPVVTPSVPPPARLVQLLHHLQPQLVQLLHHLLL